MEIYTPRGLKIRLDVNFAFALMARLYPKVDAYRVLKTTEGLELLPTAVVFIAVMIAYMLRLDTVTIAITVFAAYFISFMITILGLYIIPGLPAIGTIYSYISGYGIAFVIIAVVGFIRCGISGVVAYFVGWLIAWLVCYIVDAIKARQAYNQFGMVLWNSERNYINAYRLYASRYGITTHVDVSEEEMEITNWIACFTDMERNYPQAAARYTINY